jgi:hypothetical protein
MSPRRQLLATVLSAVLCAACEMRFRPAAPSAPPDGRGVGLIVEGPPFDAPAVARRVKDAVEGVSGRRVVMVGADGDVVQGLVARLRKTYPSIASRDWRDRGCRAADPVLTALANEVDGIYRVSLRNAERTRPATAVEAATRGRTAKLLHALHLGGDESVREESVSGSIVMTGFAGEDRSVRVAIARSTSRVAPTVFTDRLDAGEVAADAIRSLPPLPAPRWDAVARRLLAAGCPFAALAVSEMRLEGVPKRAALRTAALAAMRRNVKPQRARTPAPSRPDAAEAAGDRETPVEDGRYSCPALCSMHMVELCNRDRSLWSAHGAQWRETPCGAKRGEPFLAECYRQQWLSGAYHDSCVVPCESGPEGRDRLLGILQSSGCVRRRPS